MKVFLIAILCLGNLYGIPIDDYVSENPIEEEPPVQLSPEQLDKLIDLETMAQDFVLETKQIRIEGYPDAFNPSIIRFQGSLLLTFRTYNPATRATNQIGLIWLDEEFNPKGNPQFLDIRTMDPYCYSKRQDPRLISIANRLFVVYNNVLQTGHEREIRRMLFAEVQFDGTNFYAVKSDCFIWFEGEKWDRSEKNWVPFEYNGEFLLSYSLLPHRIFRPLFGQSECQTVASSFGKIKWDWGVLRGGTPALIGDDGEYLAFFHCSKSMATLHSKGLNIPHYFMGAYTFSPYPPFEITRMSPRPIIGKNFYHGPAYKTWKPLHVVFPGGFVTDDRYVWVVYGRQDHELWVAKLDKQGLYKSLVPVSTCR